MIRWVHDNIMHTSVPGALTPAKEPDLSKHTLKSEGSLWERTGKVEGVSTWCHKQNLILQTWKNTSAQIWDSKLSLDLGRQ